MFKHTPALIILNSALLIYGIEHFRLQMAHNYTNIKQPMLISEHIANFCKHWTNLTQIAMALYSVHCTNCTSMAQIALILYTTHCMSHNVHRYYTTTAHKADFTISLQALYQTCIAKETLFLLVLHCTYNETYWRWYTLSNCGALFWAVIPDFQV